MTIDAERVRNWAFPALRQTYTEKDTILYALSLGFGARPCDGNELSFVYENGLQAVPTFATNLCHPGLWISNPATGIDVTQAVHGEHHMRFHEPLPVSGMVRASCRVTDLIDKGPGRGALLVVERLLYDETSGKLLASIEQRTILRGDGGFSGGQSPKDVPPSIKAGEGEQRPATPDHIVDLASLPQASLIYRLSADPNPLHADPQVARAAGFQGPILHGLATYGLAARAIIQSCCRNRASALTSLGARFSAPVYPGETIRTEIWLDGPTLRFQCSVPVRDVIVISNGTATLGTTS